MTGIKGMPDEDWEDIIFLRENTGALKKSPDYYLIL
jgi:hypothetical protein